MDCPWKYVHKKCSLISWLEPNAIHGIIHFKLINLLYKINFFESSFCSAKLLNLHPHSLSFNHESHSLTCEWVHKGQEVANRSKSKSVCLGNWVRLQKFLKWKSTNHKSQFKWHICTFFASSSPSSKSNKNDYRLKKKLKLLCFYIRVFLWSLRIAFFPHT